MPYENVLFSELQKILFHLQVEIFQKCKPEFLVQWKAPCVYMKYSAVEITLRVNPICPLTTCCQIHLGDLYLPYQAFFLPEKRVKADQQHSKAKSPPVKLDELYK